MSKRRNPFDQDQASAVDLPKPPDLYESLPVAAPRKRSRAWERKHISQKAVYRGVDPKLALQVKEIAQEYDLREGEVARFLLEYALDAYAHGRLNLRPRPNPNRLRMTLFPKEGQTKSMIPRGKAKKNKTTQPTWKVITTWRGFSPELKRELSALASPDGLDVPQGELVSAFLRYSLHAYQQGLLKLEPVPEVRGNTLYEEGSL